MKSNARAASIHNAYSLGTEVTGFPTFELSNLIISKQLDVELPSNLRLGHLAERVVSELIKASDNYDILYENIQITEGNDTIGELDFIIQETDTAKVTHLELAYKFYLYDPSISEDPINNWIGPNRNDSLSEKLSKLRTKQFPLLHDERTAKQRADLTIGNISQALCLLASLYLPYGFEAELSSVFQQSYAAFAKTIKGYYLDFETLSSLDSLQKTYYLPAKKEWGMEPSENENWAPFTDIEDQLSTSLNEKRALLCWQKHEEVYSEFFVAYW